MSPPQWNSDITDPVETTDARLVVRARVEHRSGRRLRISGELLGPDGKKSVSASGLYLVTHTIDQVMQESAI